MHQKSPGWAFFDMIRSMLQIIVHYFLHFLFPGLIARTLFKERWKSAWLIIVATMLVDLDHLLATPVFLPDRCSINFHPLHTYYAMAVYAAMLFLPKPYRIIGLGLLLHMLTDSNDCVMTYLNRL